MKTLVVQTAFLGDTVFTSALVDGLSKAGHDVDVCIAPRGRDVALAMPSARAVLVYDKRGADRGLGGLRRMAARLRERGYGLAVLPHESLRTAALARLAGIPRRVGFARAAASRLYTDRVRTKALGFLGREHDLLRALGAPRGEMRLAPRPEWVEAARRALGSHHGEQLAALCIGSEWGTKIWPAEHYAALARRLADDGLRPVLVGGPKDRPLAQRIGGAGGALDTLGNPVGEAIGLLSLCTLVVGGDTGLVHAARALGVPTVALFGPTPSAVHELGARARAVSLELPCAPCSAHGPRRCPLGHHRCMRDLDEERVLRACEAVLGS